MYTLPEQACMLAQDFDKLDGILKDYKRFMSECSLIDRTLPTHVNLDGFSNDGLKIHVHVCLGCTPLPDGPLSVRPRLMLGGAQGFPAGALGPVYRCPYAKRRWQEIYVHHERSSSVQSAPLSSLL